MKGEDKQGSTILMSKSAGESIFHISVNELRATLSRSSRLITSKACVLSLLFSSIVEHDNRVFTEGLHILLFF